MSYSKITLRYAAALFDLAAENKHLEEVHSDMNLLAGICASNHDFKVMLADPVVHADKKQKVVERIFAGKASPLTLSFMKLLIRKNREIYLPPIAEAFADLYKASKGIKTAIVSSATGLSTSEKNRILQILGRITDHTIDLVEKTDATLLGGFVVNVDDFQIDQSLSTKIKELKKDFEKNLFVKGF